MDFLGSLLGEGSPTALPVVFGCEQLGGYEWGEVDIGEIRLAIAEAVELGVRLFDTADCYGRGVSESRLGRALGSGRDSATISTKFGVRFNARGGVFYDSSPEWCEVALLASLERLGTDWIDLYQIHYWDGVTPLDDTVAALERLRSKGLIRAYGLSNTAWESVPSSIWAGLSTYSMEYSLLNREHEDSARRAVAFGGWFMPYGVLAQGLLSGKYDIETRFGSDDRRSDPRYRHFTPAGLRRGMRMMETLRACARDLNASPAQLAIAWTRKMIPRCLPLVGIKSSRQLTEAAEGSVLDLPEDVTMRLLGAVLDD